MKKKTKTAEPSLLDQLNAPLRAIVHDFQKYGAEALETVRAKNPERYLELATKLLPLIVQLNPAGSDFSGCRTAEDIGIKLLLSVGIADPTDAQIADAIKANDEFIARLQGISVLGQMDVSGEPN
jgi:hypothetical protein